MVQCKNYNKCNVKTKWERIKMQERRYRRKKPIRKLLKNENSSSSSISPFAEYFSTTSTQDTFSIFSEPFPISEPSWNFDLLEEEKKSSTYFFNWQKQSFLSSISAEPKQTSSSYRPSPDISESKLTITMLNPGSLTESVPVTVKDPSRPRNPFEEIDGLSIWTIESLRSGAKDSSDRCSKTIKVNYPWSPQTGSEKNSSAYPSSDSLFGYYQSKDSLKTYRSFESTDTLPNFGLGIDQEAIDSYLISVIKCDK